MMKAAVVVSFDEPLTIKEISIPKIGPNQILIKNIACGVCHSDLHLARGDWEIKPPLPRILGHEGIGQIVELGSNVGNHLKLGDIVGVPWIQKTCLHCEYCLTGRETLCTQQINTAFAVDGCFAEYSSMDADFAVKLPEGMDPYASAPLYCAGVTVYTALKASEVRCGQWISIVGVGGLGSLAIKYALAMGMKVIAVVAPNDQKSACLAKDLGAHEVFDGPSAEHGKWIQSKVGGVQASIVCVPSTQAYEEAFKSVKRGGQVVAVGLPAKDISLSILYLVLSGIKLIGSVVGTRQDLREALELARLHNIVCKVERRKLEEINQIFDDLALGKVSGRIVLDFVAQ